MGYTSTANSVKLQLQPKHADSPIDIDTVELSGVSQAIVTSVSESGKAVHIDDPEYDDLFSAIDVALQEQKKQTQEHTEYLEKYREKQRVQKHIQDQKALSKAALMKDSGVLWTSELSDEAKQIVMSQSPQAISDYKLEKKLKKEAAQ
jgi:hypothetical protein